MFSDEYPYRFFILVPIIFLFIVISFNMLFDDFSEKSSFSSSVKFSAEIEITDIGYTESRTYYTFTGKVMIPYDVPASYRTYFKWNDIEFISDKKEVYDYCKESVGEKVNAYFDYDLILTERLR